MARIDRPPDQGWICPDYRDDVADPQVLRDAITEAHAAGWISEQEAAELWPSDDRHDTTARATALGMSAVTAVPAQPHPLSRAAVDARYAELCDQYPDPQRWVAANDDAWAPADVDSDGW
jgi:hypothetical protein